MFFVNTLYSYFLPGNMLNIVVNMISNSEYSMIYFFLKTVKEISACLPINGINLGISVEFHMVTRHQFISYFATTGNLCIWIFYAQII